MIEPARVDAWNISNLRTLYLSPTNVCNYFCVMCFNQMTKTDRGFLDWDLFEQIINELVEIRRQVDSQFSEFHFYLDGEPFLHKEYVEMLRYIDRSLSGVRVIISTNGALMTPDKIDDLLRLNSNQYIYIISLDASNEELYRKIKPRSDFTSAEENARYFLAKKIENNINNPYAVLQFIVMSINEQNMHDFYWKWEPLIGPMTKAGYCLWTDSLLRENSSHIYWKRFHHRSNPVQIDHPLYSNRNGPSIVHDEYTKVCAWPWRVLAIGWNGDAHPCCFFPESKSMLGTIRGKNITQIFEGMEIKQMRWHFLRNSVDQIPVCNTCDHKAWWHDKGLEDHLGI
ncbi:MAG: radical SAM/SPASM domain-containing protein [Acidobacteriota bacterium]